VPARTRGAGVQHGQPCASDLRAVHTGGDLGEDCRAGYPRKIEWNGPVQIIYQTVENLHAAVPNHTGDWYFTGKYPTPGGYRVVNQAYVNYFEKHEGRSY